MTTMTINGVKVTVTGDMPPYDELEGYVARGLDLHGGKLWALDVELDGDYVGLNHHLRAAPFQRLRRITGYLVGSTDRWNPAKHAEESDRVKHLTVERGAPFDEPQG